jgi:hypothetical protein
MKITNYPTKISFVLINKENGKQADGWIIFGQYDKTQRYTNPEKADIAAAVDYCAWRDKFKSGKSVIANWTYDGQSVINGYINREKYNLKITEFSPKYENAYEYIEIGFN